MWKTALLLIVALVVIPAAAFYADDPLTPAQKVLLTELITVYLIAAALCFVVSTLADNYSQVDKLWSIMPVVYAWIMGFRSGFEPRLVLMAVLVTLWGARLTFNFARRGGYSWRFWSGEQDYRWPILKSKPEFSGRWRWTAFNLLFISLYQMGLILLITLPALRSLDGQALQWFDYAIAALFIAFLIIETVADQQQWNFQKEKRRLLASGGPLPEKYSRGFIYSGLWGFVRHPNYASEQAVWIVFYLFSISATGLFLNWSVIGCVLLVMLFMGSSDFSESVSASRYPTYADYARRVPRYIPDMFGKRIK
ncbi:MAG: DUF1295 domain-containing protein [Bacteroidales bacterium]|nr:DUF1295 domain-containing protein [Bacteroidales bacterium]